MDDEDEILMTCSPEPPEPLEMEGLIEADENSQPGRLDPELDLPHIFKVCASPFRCFCFFTSQHEKKRQFK